MTETPPQAPLSPSWAFGVQLREGTALAPDALQGGVEHIASGQATLFGSVRELLAFMADTVGSGSGAPRTRGRRERR
jgi:hypothetical protein